MRKETDVGSPSKNRAGKKIGDWTAIKRDGHIGTNAAWLCRCKNGHEKRIAANRFGREKALLCRQCRGARMREIYQLDAEFVPLWQQASSVEEVACNLGITEQEVKERAARLRRHKVPLKHMARGRRVAEEHYAKMRQLAEEAKED